MFMLVPLVVLVFIFIPQYSSIMLDVVIGVETDGKEKNIGGIS